MECSAEGGDFKGVGVNCKNVPECREVVARNVPTISQWGMIAMAGLLGIFSLFVIMRRQRYNVG